MRRLLTTLGVAGLLLAALVWLVRENYDHIAAFVLHPQTATATTISDESFGLITSDGRRFALADLDVALAALTEGSSETRPLVIFVHGFGPNPDGEFGLYTMNELAKGSNADVLMFNWPSWISLTEFPVLNAAETAGRLSILLEQIARMKTPGGLLEHRPVSIVAHSLGGEVTRNLALAEPDLPAGILARYILAVPETALPDHRSWLQKLTFADEVFVFVNSDDPALQVTTLMYRTARLGRSIVNLDGTPEPLASNADYILLDPESWRHFFFISGQRNEAIDDVFSDILRRGAAALSNTYLRREPSGNVHVVVGPGAEAVDD